MNAPSRLLVLGGDAAGMTAASHVRRHAPQVEVVVVEKTHHTSNSMCGIPFYVGAEIADADDLVVRTPDEFRAMGMTVHMRTEALAIDPVARRVRVRDLESGAERDEPYDRLLYTVGAHVVPPPVPGVREHGHVVHTLDDGEHLRAHLDQQDGERERGEDKPGDRHVVVVGAGYIGIEIAEALVRRGFDATVIDRSPQVLGSLDADMAALVQRRMEDFGIRVRLGETFTEARGLGGSSVAVVCERGVYETEVLVIATGAQPSVAMARAAGCRVGPSGALVVDPQGRTTVDGIWAAGDCVETLQLVSGQPVNVQLGTHANKQGKAAGIDIVAAVRGTGRGEAAFPGVVGTAVTKLCEWEIARTGVGEDEAAAAGIDAAAVRFTGTAKASYLPDPGEVHVKMLAEQGTGRVLGAQMVGSGNVAKRIDVAATWCQLGVTVQQAQFLDLSYSPPFGGVWDLLQVGARKLVRELGLSPVL